MWFGSHPDGGILLLFGEAVPLVARGGGQLVALVRVQAGELQHLVVRAVHPLAVVGVRLEHGPQVEETKAAEDVRMKSR